MKIFFYLVILFLCVECAFGQNKTFRTLRGEVKGGNLKNQVYNIRVQGLNAGVQTDSNARFVINLPAEETVLLMVMGSDKIHMFTAAPDDVFLSLNMNAQDRNVIEFMKEWQKKSTVMSEKLKALYQGGDYKEYLENGGELALRGDVGKLPNIMTNVSDRPYDFSRIDVKPEFPGGEKAMQKFVRSLMPAKTTDVSGRFLIRFVVEKDGSLSDVKILRGLCKVCDEQLLEAINKMPEWKPGAQQGKTVRTVVTTSFDYF